MTSIIINATGLPKEKQETKGLGKLHGIFQDLKISFNQSPLSCLDVVNTIHENSWTDSLLQKTK